jgi:hypothetical protein
MLVVITGLMLLPFSGLFCEEKLSVSVFYKEREPSQRVLQRVSFILERYRDSYNIDLYNIDNDDNAEFISELGLPSTHFPFAVVIAGKYTANIDGKTVSFVHFPLFMQGIGRHEGNWSLADVEKCLADISLLAEENALPELDKSAETTECED